MFHSLVLKLKLGKVNRDLEPGHLGAAFSKVCPSSWRVVKESSSRFESPIPKRIIRSIKQAAATIVDEVHAAAMGWTDETANSKTLKSQQVEEGSRDDLCMRSPNHWACRGVTSSEPIPTQPPTSFKVCD